MVRESKLRGDEVSKLNYPTASLMRHTSATGTMDKLIPIVSSALVNFREKKSSMYWECTAYSFAELGRQGVLAHSAYCGHWSKIQDKNLLDNEMDSPLKSFGCVILTKMV